MSRLTLGRRRLLAALGLGTAAAAPVFRRGISHVDAQSETPKRFIGVYHPAGWRLIPRSHGAYARDQETADSMCFPGKRRNADYRLDSVTHAWPEETAPLQRIQDDLVFVEGLDNWANRGGNNHMNGIHTFLTGADPQSSRVGGPSLDYFLSSSLPASGRGMSVSGHFRSSSPCPLPQCGQGGSGGPVLAPLMREI